jgi:hypothetical protein
LYDVLNVWWDAIDGAVSVEKMLVTKEAEMDDDAEIHRTRRIEPTESTDQFRMGVLEIHTDW